MWWKERDRTLEERLDAVLEGKEEPHHALFTPPQREPQDNYELGVLLLRRAGIRLTLDRKGPLCLHYAEGLPTDPQRATEALQAPFRQADRQLREFWRPLWELKSGGPLRQHARYLLRREEAIRANSRQCSVVERLRAEVEDLKAEVRLLRAQASVAGGEG